MARSEKPCCLASRRSSGDSALDVSRSDRRVPITESISFRNHGSMPESVAISWTVMPFARARATARMRRGDGLRSSLRRSSPVNASGSSPSTPISIMRSAFCSTSGKVRPMAMTSPTLFISLPMRVSTSRNFCRSQRGNLQTM